MKKRKGTLLFEIILGLAAFLFMMSVTMPSIRYSMYERDVHTYIHKTDDIIKNTIMDTYQGYASANNSYCAPDYVNSFKDLTVYRLVKCSNLENTIPYYYNNSNVANEKDPTKSFLYNMNEWIKDTSKSKYGCKLFASQGNTTSQFNIFFDCSALKNPAGIDSEILVYYKKNYPTKLIEYNINALSIDPAYVPKKGDNPSDTDGKILLKFQK